MDRLRENQIYTGTVEGYSSEGLGIVRLDSSAWTAPWWSCPGPSGGRPST